jgi:pimeloyl-ACP methyl ester carboxylesterase
VEAIAALVEHHVPKGERVDVVGISYGGFVALRCGTIAPHRQRRLVIMDSPGPLFSATDQAALLERFGVEQPQDIFVPDDPEDVRVLIQLAYHKAPPLPRTLLKDMLRQVFGQHRVEQAQLLSDIEAGRERYAGLAPAEYENSLVIWGEHDRVFPVAIGRQLSELLGAEFVVIEGAAHAPHIERPRQVNPILVDFLGAEATGG